MQLALTPPVSPTLGVCSSLSRCGLQGEVLGDVRHIRGKSFEAQAVAGLVVSELDCRR